LRYQKIRTAIELFCRLLEPTNWRWKSDSISSRRNSDNNRMPESL